MTIAWYTRQMMKELKQAGETECYHVSIGVTAARSRLQNAARRLGVRITTRRDDSFIVATVKKGS